MDTSGFSPLFESCRNAAKQPFESFRSDPAFDFLRPVREQIYAVDWDALEVAFNTNLPLALKYLALEKPNLGYENLQYYALDMIDCRHIMMSTILFTHVPDAENIVEIGGGFGNWARINLQIQKNLGSWAIIDLDFVLELQKWYLERAIPKDISSKLFFVPFGDPPPQEQIDVVIAAHSLSEISLEQFESYLPLLDKTEYLFYARHQHYPSPDLASHKLDRLFEKFDLYANVKTERGLVDNFILKRR